MKILRQAQDDTGFIVMLNERSVPKHPPPVAFGFSKTTCVRVKILRQAQDDRLVRTALWFKTTAAC